MTAKNEFSRYFRDVQPKFPRLCMRHLSQVKITMPQFALLNILASVGTMQMTEVSGKLHITKPAVTNLVDRLEKNLYLKRMADPEDRRVSLIKILPKGAKLVQEMQSAILEYLLEAFEKFNGNEQKIISRFYAVLSETMDGYLNQEKPH